jgi:hypothetical protein
MAQQSPPQQSTPEPAKPFTVRTAFVLFLALMAGVVAGFLFYSATHSVGLAVITGGAAFAGGWRLFDRLIG